jgi:hypothetical protein
VTTPLSIAGAADDTRLGAAQLRNIATWALALLASVSMFDFGLSGSRPSRPLGVLVGIICLVALGLEGRRRRLTGAHFLGIVVVVGLCLSTTWSGAPDASTAAFSAVQLLVLFLLAFEFVDSPAAWNRLASGLALGGGTLTLLVLRQFVSGAIVNGGRYTGFSSGDPNDVAWGISIGSTLLAHFAFTARDKRLRWAAGTLAALGIPATILTGSRSGVIVLVLGLMIVPWRLSLAGPRTRARFALLFVVGLALVVATIPNEADFRGVDRVLAGAGGEGEGTVVERSELLAESFRAIGDEPLKGVGIASVEGAMIERIHVDLGVHNSFASVAMQAGVIAGGAWLLFWFVVARSAWRANNPLRPVLVALATLTIVELMFRHGEYQKPLWFTAALLISGPCFGFDQVLRPMADPSGESLALRDA